MGRVKGGRGYLYIDNRPSGGQLLEFNTLTCAHCNTVVVLNPERKRRREWCHKCNAYICDSVGCNAECNPIQQGVELALKYPELGQPFLPRGKNGEVLFDTQLRDKEKPWALGGLNNG